MIGGQLLFPIGVANEIGIADEASRHSKRTLIDIHVGGQLRSKRIDHGFAQSALANIVRVPLARIDAYETGYDRIEPEHLIQFSALFGASISSFFPGI